MAARMRVPRHDDFEDPEQEVDTAEEEDHESEADPAPWETTAEHSTAELDQSTSTVTTGTEDADVFDSTPQPSRSRSHSRSHSRQGLFDPNKTPSESSFLPGGDIISSTPAAVGKRRAAGLVDDGPSWTSSIESSLHRLNEELDMLGMAPNQTSQSQASSTSTVDATPTSSIHGSTHAKGKGRAKPPESPMLRGILTKNANTSTVKKAPPSPIPFDVGIPGLSTPLRRDAAKILAKMNPYLPSNTKPTDWSSVVDLSVHKLSSPKRHPPESSSSSSRLLSEGGGFDTKKRSGYGLPSPVTIRTFERPSRGQGLQQTPRKEAVARIGKDLLWDAGHRQQLFNRHGSVVFFITQVLCSYLPP
jgi:DASH complex subunit ASK1